MDKPSSILVVDDIDDNRETLGRRLERSGYRVRLANDGHDALRQAAVHCFDLIILDIMMPGMNGMEVLQNLRQKHSRTSLPVIMATARDQSKDVVEALNAGANDYVVKPLDFGVVLARVRTHLQLKQAVDQIKALETGLKARNEELHGANLQLTRNAQRTAAELSAAAKVQKAFLPRPNFNMPGATFAWTFEPTSELAGDSLNIVHLDDHHVGFYVLDVSGHGVAAALSAVAVTRLLSPSATGDSLVQQVNPDGSRNNCAPYEVANRLARDFRMEATNQFITLFYALFNTSTRQLTYISAGHPGAIRISRGGQCACLDGTGLPIGVGTDYEQQAAQLEPGDRIYLYTDGVTEAMDQNDTHFGTERLLQSLAGSRSLPLRDAITHVKSEVAQWRSNAASCDDLTVVAMECV